MKKFYIKPGMMPEVLEHNNFDGPYYTIRAWNIESARHVVNENIKRIPAYYM